MSTCSPNTMINHHEFGFFGQIAGTLHVWSERWHQRRELARWTERELHDVGLAWSDVVNEAHKPFWRA
jgi:uncharacterized protein YjiS (DUF1127 family)